MNTRNDLRSMWIALGAFSAYFGFLLILKVYPAFGGSSGAYLLSLSLLLVAPIVLLLVVWGVGTTLVSRIRKQPIGKVSRIIGQVAFAGVLSSSGFLAASYFIPEPLPQGSYLAPFDRSSWLDPTSVAYVAGDITPRQKMLAAVVSRLPGRNRQEIKQMLGPSLETSYFLGTGRDLIYVTGPQRDSFFGIDSEWLLIWLNETGRFKRYAILSD